MKKNLFSFLLLFVFQLYADTISSQLGIEDFLTGKELKMQHNFKNNILSIGNKLDFAGTSLEDVVLFGINVRFSGSSKKDVYIGGDTVVISGNINGNLRVIARNLEIRNLVVGGNLNIMAPEISIFDDVKANQVAKIWSRKIQIGGTYNSLYIRTKNVIFSKNIDVKNKLLVHCKEKPAIPLRVLSSCDFTYQPAVPRPAQIFLSSKFIRIYSFLGLCFPFVLMIIFTPRILREIIEGIEKKPVRIFFTGILLLLVIPLILVFLMITVVGAPLGLIFLTFYISLLYLCRGFTCIVLGRLLLWKLKGEKIRTILGIFVGTGIFVLLTSIPRIGYLIQLLFLIVGFGGVASGRARMFLKMRKENLL
ncbi:MAG: hypothetical protein NC907_00825 [Candidatus Omnitrophica bacterium]|nr:hypothetical protein [Candidatus Omnitrophota bacterium]MCM8788315.1 hypothetical protein [Candidatus Omnitrophota bacterium]